MKNITLYSNSLPGEINGQRLQKIKSITFTFDDNNHLTSFAMTHHLPHHCIFLDFNGGFGPAQWKRDLFHKVWDNASFYEQNATITYNVQANNNYITNDVLSFTKPINDDAKQLLDIVHHDLLKDLHKTAGDMLDALTRCSVLQVGNQVGNNSFNLVINPIVLNSEIILITQLEALSSQNNGVLNPILSDIHAQCAPRGGDEAAEEAQVAGLVVESDDEGF